VTDAGNAEAGAVRGDAGNAPIRAAVLVVSDRVSAGRHEDLSGPAAVSALVAAGAEIVASEAVPDERAVIAGRLLALADRGDVDLVVTSGGTGFAARDVTPEATRDVIERDAPGLAELLRRESARATPLAALGRGVAGIRGRALIVNLPGSPRAVAECLDVLIPLLPHAVRLLRGEDPGHPAWPDANADKPA
jgi:molybdenum cofactor synthesis domain-containing protein